MTGLEKLTLEIPFEKGQGQKQDPAVAETEVPYYLRNAELRKSSTVVKRPGSTALSTTTIGSPAFGAARRLASVNGELVAVTETVGSYGSGGGVADGGDTVFSRSETAAAWKAFGKIQRPTLEVLYPAVPHKSVIDAVDCCVGGGYMLTAERDSTFGIYYTITDLASNTEVVNAICANGGANDLLIKCVAAASRLCILFYDVGDDQFKLVSVNYSTTSFTTTTYSLGFGKSAAATKTDIVAGGTDVYISYPVVSGGNQDVVVSKVSTTTGTIASPVTAATFASSFGGDTALNLGTTELCLVYLNATNEVHFRYTTALTPVTFHADNVLVATSTLISEGIGALRVLWISSGRRIVFWQRRYDSSTEISPAGGALSGSGTPAGIYWTNIISTGPAVLSGAIHQSINVAFWSEPFLLSSRAFLPVLCVRHNTPSTGGGSMGYYSGAYMTELGLADNSENVVSLMPHSTLALDIVGQRFGRAMSIYDSKAYAAITRRQMNPFDPDGQLYYVEYSTIMIAAHDFGDAYRWQPAVCNQGVVFAGALPYVYDGVSVHECGFAWRPEIMDKKLAAGGSLSSGTAYSFRVTYEWRDGKGSRWYSQASYATEAESITPSGGNLSVQLAVKPLTVSMMSNGEFYFSGKVYAVLWRATVADAAQGIWHREQEIAVAPYMTANVVFTSTAADTAIDGAEQLYTVGGELENYTAPPCRALVQHRDRLFAYNTEWGTLDYTKPMTAERGIEWSLSQRIPCPEPIIALESLEHVLLAFSRNKIYVLEGAGPSVTGQPPDAFARLTLVNADIGCSEPCAAWRCPAGVVFRTIGGFWMVTRSLEVIYIGAAIETDYDSVIAAYAGVVDAKHGCLRIYTDGGLPDATAGSLTRFNFWYDTGRWSVDEMIYTGNRHGAYHESLNYFINAAGTVLNETTSYTDNGSFYPLKIKTAWIRFGDLHSFKRVWRFFVSGETDSTNNSGIQVLIGKDHDTGTPFVNESYTPTQLGTAGAKALRFHMPVQKVRSLQVTLVELQNGAGTPANTRGFKYYGIGFELGLKRGGVKLPAAVSR